MQQETNNSPIDLSAIIEDNLPSLIPDEASKQEQDKVFEVAQKKRDESTKSHLHKVFIAFIWIAFICFAIVFLIRIIHFVILLDWHWLNSEQVQGIDKMIFSGAIGGFIAKYFNRLNN